MLTPKDEVIDNWFNFFKIVIFWISPIAFDTQYVGIAYGRQDILT
jgi:hypothetical protein